MLRLSGFIKLYSRWVPLRCLQVAKSSSKKWRVALLFANLRSAKIAPDLRLLFAAKNVHLRVLSAQDKHVL